MSPGQFLGSSNSHRYHWILKLLIKLKNQMYKSKIVWLFCYFNFERNYDVLGSKSPCILLDKDINFHKNETTSKMENPIVLEERTLCFSSYKDRKLKVKLWWVGAHERKIGFLYRLFYRKEFFLTFRFLLSV